MGTIGRPANVAIGIALAASLITVACTSEPSAGVPTNQASTSPDEDASTSGPPLVQEGGAPLGPGTYTTVFEPKITFTTDASWVSYADSPRFVQFERADEHGGIAFEYVDKVFDPARDHHLMPVPRDYVSWLTGLPGVRVIAGPKEITVDGIEGTEVDLQATKDAPTVDCDDPCVAVWPLGPSDVAAISSVWVTRLVVLRLRGEIVEIGACCAPGADFAALAKDFDVIIQSVHFG